MIGFVNISSLCISYRKYTQTYVIMYALTAIRMYFVWDIMKKSYFHFKLFCLVHCLYHGGIEERFHFNGNDYLA